MALRLVFGALGKITRNITPKQGIHVRTLFVDVPEIDQSILKGMISSHSINVQGNPIHYQKTGHGNRLVFLLPGMLGSAATDFEPQLKGLNKDIFTIIAWDPPGFGKSRPPDRTWPKDWLVRDAEVASEFLSGVTSKKASLMGWSDGGVTATILAARFPHQVDRLISWGGAAYVSEVDLKVNEGISDMNNWSHRMKEPYVDMYGEEYFARQCIEWCQAYNAYFDHSDGSLCKNDLPNVKCPTLIIHGQKDPLVGQFHADYLHENIEGSKLINVPRGSHNLHLRYHDLFNSICEQFIINPDNVQSKLLFETLREKHLENA